MEDNSICGISGVIASKKTTMHELQPFNRFLATAAIVGVVRGEDSTGMVQVRKTGKILTHRVPNNGLVFEKEKKSREMLSNVDISNVSILHHRAATRGAISVSNTHPFEHHYEKRHVIGVHNGTVNNNKSVEDGIDFDVDSDWLYYRIAKVGAPVAIGETYGAMSLLWWENDGKVRMYSNKQRPLHFAFAKDVDAVMFMSEADMLWYCANNNGIKINESGILYSSKEENILVFDPENPREFTVEKIKEKVYCSSPSPVPFVRGHDWKKTGNSTLIGENGSVEYRNTTIQAHEIRNDAALVREKLGWKMGEEVEVFECFKVAANYPTTAFCEVLGNDGVTHYGVMNNLNKMQKDEITKCWRNNGDVKARVIGLTSITLSSGEKFLAAHLCPPTGMVHEEGKVVDYNLVEIVDDGDEQDYIGTNLIPTEVPGPNNTNISVARFRELVNGGCSGCTGPIILSDAPSIKWKITDIGTEPLCSTCQTEGVT